MRILNNTKVVELVTWRGVGTGALVAGVPGVAGLVVCRTVAALCGVAGLGAPGLTRGAEVGVATAGDWPVKNTFMHLTCLKIYSNTSGSGLLHGLGHRPRRGSRRRA